MCVVERVRFGCGMACVVCVCVGVWGGVTVRMCVQVCCCWEIWRDDTEVGVVSVVLLCCTRCFVDRWSLLEFGEQDGIVRVWWPWVLCCFNLSPSVVRD